MAAVSAALAAPGAAFVVSLLREQNLRAKSSSVHIGDSVGRRKTIVGVPALVTGVLGSNSCALAASGGSYGAASSRRVSEKWLPNSVYGQRVQTRAVREIKGDILKGRGLRIAVVAARFNDIITKPLLAGALETFRNYGLNDEDIDVYWVPGSFEIPVTAQVLAKSHKYDSVLSLGAVVRGATTHYDAVANSAASGLLSASLNSGCPCIFGVLTTENMEQAFDRAGGKAGNKGSECALTAIEMASLFRHQISELTSH